MIEGELLELRRAGLTEWKSPRERVREAAEMEAQARTDAVTFAAYGESWLENVAAPRVKPRVLYGYTHAIRKVWTPVFGEAELGAITRRQVNDVVARMSGDGRAASTIRGALIPHASLFRHAIEEDALFVTNPAARIRIPAEARERRRRIVPPTRAQVEAVIRAASPDVQDAIGVASATGLRRGELFGLIWQDVDFDRSLIAVRRSNYGAKIATTKSEAGDRNVPLFESARKALAARKLRSRFSNPDDFVFGTVIGTAENPDNWVRREFLPTLDRANLPAFRWHDLRHFAVSALIAERADVKLLQAIAGHASAALTLDVYGHLMTERVEEAALLYDPLRQTV